MDKDGSDRLALEIARDLVVNALPLWVDKAENGYPVSHRGPFWGGVDFNDETAVRARLEEMTTFIGGLAQRLKP